MLKEGKLVIGEYRFFQDFFDGQIVKGESERFKLFKVLLFSIVSTIGLFLTFMGVFGYAELILLMLGIIWNVFSGLGKKVSYLISIVVALIYAFFCINFRIYANNLIL